MPRSSGTVKEFTRRQEASEQKRQAILEAGLDVFADKGFAAARLDDVALKAGVAKGTIYLSFKDKEDLFEQIVVGAVSPVLESVTAFVRQNTPPLDVFLRMLFEVFRTEILDTRRKDVVRLVITEGARFPRIAEFYHREVVANGLALIREVSLSAYARGELSTEGLARFPHLVVAPLLLSVVWDELFSKIQPLDVEGLMATHRRILIEHGKFGGNIA